jgi:hypothetical protein
MVSIGVATRYLGTLSQMIVNMVLVCYVCACLWYWYARQVDAELTYTYTFMQDNARVHDPYDDSTFLRVLYFILTTVSTVGYGDYLP